MAYYRVPPPTGEYFGYQPASSGDYYIPSSYKTPTKRSHTRATSYSSPRMSPAYTSSPAGYPSPSYYAVNPSLSSPPPPTSYKHVSLDPRTWTTSKTPRRSSMSTGGGNNYPHNNDQRFARIRTSTHPIYVDTTGGPHNDSSGTEGEPIYITVEPQGIGRKTSMRKTSQTSSATMRPRANSKSYKQDIIDIDTPIRSRARRGSTASRTGASTAKAIPIIRQATEADAIAHKIPAGYCMKNWDPSEQPVILLGSVFDSNKLGKWIYDWTVYAHKSHSPLADMAGELWLLLIKFAGKMTRAEEGIRRVRYQDDEETLDKFLVAGDRIYRKLKSLIKACEAAMMANSKKSKDGSKKVVMDEKSGVAFVNCFFGPDDELARTEKFMQAMRKYVVDFDDQCEDILYSLKRK